MKKLVLSFMALGALQLGAQDLPMPSPTATFEQLVGLTDVKIEYSRPGVKDREVFGELVPYGELWRTGANKVPNIHFSTDVVINGEPVEAGSYALLTIPQQGSWTIILNSNTEMWGTGGYDESKDVLRTEVESQETDFTESFTIDVNDLRNESASLVLRWAKTEVKVPMKVAVHEQAMANIDKALEEGPADKKWQVYRNAANYYYNNDLNLDQALAYMEQSIAAKSDSWYSHWLNAEILAKKSEYDAAIKSAQRALKAGEANAVKDGEEFSYANMIEESITEWKNKKKES